MRWLFLYLLPIYFVVSCSSPQPISQADAIEAVLEIRKELMPQSDEKGKPEVEVIFDGYRVIVIRTFACDNIEPYSELYFQPTIKDGGLTVVYDKINQEILDVL